MFPETIPLTPPTDHDTAEARRCYIIAQANRDYTEWLQEEWHCGVEPGTRTFITRWAPAAGRWAIMRVVVLGAVKDGLIVDLGRLGATLATRPHVFRSRRRAEASLTY